MEKFIILANKPAFFKATATIGGWLSVASLRMPASRSAQMQRLCLWQLPAEKPYWAGLDSTSRDELSDEWSPLQSAAEVDGEYSVVEVGAAALRAGAACVGVDPPVVV